MQLRLVRLDSSKEMKVLITFANLPEGFTVDEVELANIAALEPARGTIKYGSGT